MSLTLGDALNSGGVGIALVLSGLVVLAVVLVLMARNARRPASPAPAGSAPVAPAPAAPAAFAAAAPAPREVELTDVSEADAAMIMAVVADSLEIAPAELCVKSIRLLED